MQLIIKKYFWVGPKTYNSNPSLVGTSYFHPHRVAELRGKWYAVEVMTIRTVVDRRHVEKNDQHCKEAGCYNQADDDPRNLSAPVQLVKCYVRQKGKWQHETNQKSYKVRIIVDVRQQSQYEQEEQNGKLFGQRTPWMLDDVKVLDHLDE